MNFNWSYQLLESRNANIEFDWITWFSLWYCTWLMLGFKLVANIYKTHELPGLTQNWFLEYSTNVFFSLCSSRKFQKSELLYLDVFGMLNDSMLQTLRAKLPNIEINKFYFSSVARPTVGIRRTSIWSLKVREWAFRAFNPPFFRFLNPPLVLVSFERCVKINETIVHTILISIL